MSDYKISDFENIIKENIDEKTDIVFMAGNFANLGMFDSRNKLDLLDSVSETVFKASKDNATIMTQSMSFQICNTDIPYERYTWANLGAFSNYLLNKKNSIRSNHPFASYTALGKNAYICDTSTPFAYGIKSPYDNMLKFDNIKMFSVGMPPNITCSIIHHAEFNMHVPYRYIKEFYHPIKIDDKIIRKNFYLHVLYKEYMAMKRNLNIKFFKYFKEKGNSIKEINLGKNKIYIYDYKKFYESSIELLLKDIYSWMSEEPKEKPFRK
ncbi:AAC(3) family N-acetyltransferase [uncultured Campylobacter sp.]|uniref:AAC(3) family N-acetyltransferase n=1 Tax=uncultured Campylobacter sp. TaxID=218934 RepID=UPI002606B459|nr:AAC(3) family N-acetyltransferase [uncultured Campylobacter sp.]